MDIVFVWHVTSQKMSHVWHMCCGHSRGRESNVSMTLWLFQALPQWLSHPDWIGIAIIGTECSQDCAMIRKECRQTIREWIFFTCKRNSRVGRFPWKMPALTAALLCSCRSVLVMLATFRDSTCNDNVWARAFKSKQYWAGPVFSHWQLAGF